MKIVNLISQGIISLILVGSLIYFLTGYDSAFEADQACHASLSMYSNQKEVYGCDHDLETHKWILYENQNNTKPAEVIKKFRYKFL